MTIANNDIQAEEIFTKTSCVKLLEPWYFQL